MPHLVILYTGNLEHRLDWNALCRRAADTMLGIRDEQGQAVYPAGGTRVFAVQAAHWAVSDGGAAGQAAGGDGDYAFVYFNLRMAGGRSDATKKAAGDALLALAKGTFDPIMANKHIGITLQIDESPGQVYDAKLSNIHPLFAAKPAA